MRAAGQRCGRHPSRSDRPAVLRGWPGPAARSQTDRPLRQALEEEEILLGTQGISAGENGLSEGVGSLHVLGTGHWSSCSEGTGTQGGSWASHDYSNGEICVVCLAWCHLHEGL